MVLVNRRRRTRGAPVLPSLTVEIVRGIDRGRPIHAAVEKLHPDSVVVRCASGVDALAVAMSPELELHFRGPGPRGHDDGPPRPSASTTSTAAARSSSSSTSPPAPSP